MIYFTYKWTLLPWRCQLPINDFYTLLIKIPIEKKGIYNYECRIQCREPSCCCPPHVPQALALSVRTPRCLQGPLPTNSAGEITPTTTLRSPQPVRGEFGGEWIHVYNMYVYIYIFFFLPRSLPTLYKLQTIKLGLSLWGDNQYLIIMNWIVPPPKIIYWSPNPKYLSIWLYLERVFKEVIKFKWGY